MHPIVKSIRTHKANEQTLRKLWNATVAEGVPQWAAELLAKLREKC